MGAEGQQPPQDFANDPLFKLLSEMRAPMGEGAGLSSGAGFGDDGLPADPLAAFSAMFGGGAGPGGFPFGDQGSAGAFPGGIPEGSSEVTPSIAVRKVDIFWSLIHVLTSISLTIYFLSSRSLALSTESTSSSFSWASSLVLLFCTAQVILHSSRFVLEKGSPPSNSKIASLASFLPNPFRQYIILVARYLHIGRVIIEDLCIVLFIVGIYFGLGTGSQEVENYDL